MMNDDEIMVWFGFPICRLLSLYLATLV